MLAGLASVEEGARIFVLPRVQHVVAAKKTKSTGNQTMNRTTVPSIGARRTQKTRAKSSYALPFAAEPESAHGGRVASVPPPLCSSPSRLLPLLTLPLLTGGSLLTPHTSESHRTSMAARDLLRPHMYTCRTVAATAPVPPTPPPHRIRSTRPLLLPCNLHPLVSPCTRP
jgi:hypothetical protein